MGKTIALLLTASVIIILLLALLSYRWFIAPATTQATAADAVVVFAGGEGERLQTAIQLMREAKAAVLLLSTGSGYWLGQAAIEKLCADNSLSYQVHCIYVLADNTAGEAADFARYAQQQQWQHIIAVTSGYHLFRASLLLRRCFKGQITPIGAGGRTRWQHVVHEWGGLLQAVVLKRRCSPASDQ